MPRLYFGTDGVRGPYGGPVINEAFAARLGMAAGRWAGATRGERRILIGRDTRASGESLAKALGSGFVAVGFEPIDIGVLPTPAVARAVRATGARLGVVVTASHNPARDNGIKFFAADGTKLSDEDELEIEAQLPEEPPANAPVPPGGREFEQNYIGAIGSLLPKDSLKGWTVAIDTANGATVRTTPVVFSKLGATVEGLGNAPDGLNINDHVGSEHPERLAEKVLATKARLGIAHDGDGDRCVLCDEKGQILDGDEILAILATHALARGRLDGLTLVVTLQSNFGLDEAITKAGGQVVRTPIGDRYVAARMRAGGFILGGESSGHIVCSDISPTGDGLVAAIKVVQVMVETGKPLSELRRVLSKYPQKTAVVTVRDKKPIDTWPTLPKAMRDLEASLGTQGRLLVRYSGTEPVLRFLVEAPTEKRVAEGLKLLVDAATSDMASGI